MITISDPIVQSSYYIIFVYNISMSYQPQTFARILIKENDIIIKIQSTQGIEGGIFFWSSTVSLTGGGIKHFLYDKPPILRLPRCISCEISCLKILTQTLKFNSFYILMFFSADGNYEVTIMTKVYISSNIFTIIEIQFSFKLEIVL